MLLSSQTNLAGTMTPFLNIHRTTFTVANFLSWAKNGELALSPSFQRRPVWPKKAKSYLIDTLSRGLPIPIVFVREITDIDTLKTIREVVDGQQRLRTLISFIDPASLKDFKESADKFQITRTHNKELSLKDFSEFPDQVRKNLLSYQIPVHVLPPDMPDSQVLDIFRRMNATGTKLNKQELRNAEFFGQFIQSVYASAHGNLQRWRRWGIFSEQQIARMDEAEFVSELYILIMNGISEQSEAVITKAYKDYDTEFPNREQIEDRFSNVMAVIEDAFGEKIAKSRISNRGIFYAYFAMTYEMLFGLGSSLAAPANTGVRVKLEKASIAASKALSSFVDLPEDIRIALSGRLNRKSVRQTVYEYLQKFVAD